MTEKEPDYLVSVQYRIAMYCICVRNCMITTCAIVGKDSAESFILVFICDLANLANYGFSNPLLPCKRSTFNLIT